MKRDLPLRRYDFEFGRLPRPTYVSEASRRPIQIPMRFFMSVRHNDVASIRFYLLFTVTNGRGETKKGKIYHQ
jgi:hypothetical protein